jgi:hypothetical protein
MPKTRQQRRARSRSPLKRRRRGTAAFTVFLLLIVAGGGVAIALLRANPQPLTRGASIGEHWHASLKMYICGQRVTNYPTVEGEIHSHGDGFMHIHPSTQAASGDLASLGTYLRLYETNITEAPDGDRELTFPDGKKYADGDRCPKSNKRYDIEVTNKGKKVEGDPSNFLPHEGDEVVIAFGPEGEKTMPNPYSRTKGIPDVGQGGATPAPDSGPPQQQPPPIPLPSGPAAPPPEASPEPSD